MTKKDIKKLQELEAELKEVTEWLDRHKVVYTEKDAKQKDFKNRQTLELQETILPLRVEYNNHLKAEKIKRGHKEEQEAAQEGLDDIESLRNILTSFDAMDLKYKSVLLEEINTELKSRYEVLGIKEETE